MKRQALTDEDYELAEHIIYNDLPLSTLYPVSKTVAYFNQEVVERIVEKGEKWVKVPTITGGIVAYTSYGRLINTKTVKILSPSISRKNILHYFSGNRFKSLDLFQLQGWEHNIEELAGRYIDRGWKCVYNHYTR